MRLSPTLLLLLLGSQFFLIPALADPGKHQQPPVPAEEDWQSRVDVPTTLKAINLFRKDPTGKDALPALAIIMAFAEMSDKVMVVVRREHLPWIDEKAISEQTMALLTGAFVAGNIEAQLQDSTKANRPYEGALLALHTYHEMRSRDMAPKISALEDWTEMDKNGKLKDFLQNMPPPS